METRAYTTYQEKYDPAMAITDQVEADGYFERLVEHSMSFGKGREEVTSPVLARLIEEVRAEMVNGPGLYNRIHNRHNRSMSPPDQPDRRLKFATLPPLLTDSSRK